MTIITEPNGKGRNSGPRRRAATVEDEVKSAASDKEFASFNLFSLPRELRDQIYEDCLTFKRKIRSQHGARLRGRRTVETSLLLVCKQLRREYLERAEQHTCLIIVDRPEFHGDFLKLPPAISNARNLELYLAIACDSPDHFNPPEHCRVVKEVRMHRKWIGDLCNNMRLLESIRINLIIDPHQYVKDCERKLLELQYKLTNVEELKALEVYHCDYTGKEGTWDFSKGRKLVMGWSADDGKLHRVEEKDASSGSWPGDPGSVS